MKILVGLVCLEIQGIVLNPVEKADTLRKCVTRKMAEQKTGERKNIRLLTQTLPN